MSKYLKNIAQIAENSTIRSVSVLIESVNDEKIEQRIDLDLKLSIQATIASVFKPEQVKEIIITKIDSNPKNIIKGPNQLIRKNIDIYCSIYTAPLADNTLIKIPENGTHFKEVFDYTIDHNTPYWKSLRKKVGHSLLLLPATAALIFNQGKILLAKGPNIDKWMIPGGLMAENELISQTVIREAKEETGLEIKPVKQLGVYTGEQFVTTYSNQDQVQIICFPFICEITGGTLNPLDRDEIEMCRFFDLDDIPPLKGEEWYSVLKAGIEAMYL